MIAVPADTPVTTPPLKLAILVLLQLQEPPAVASVSVIFAPLITKLLPEIEDTNGNALIKTSFEPEEVQPLPVTLTISLTESSESRSGSISPSLSYAPAVNVTLLPLLFPEIVPLLIVHA